MSKHVVGNAMKTPIKANNLIVQNFLFKNEKYLSYLGWLILILIAIMQELKIRGGFITNYGADIIAPIMLYYWTRTNRGLFAKLSKNGLNEIQTAILIWVLCLAWEIRQKFDLNTGVFDILDILTYSLTLLSCYYYDITRIKTIDSDKG